MDSFQKTIQQLSSMEAQDECGLYQVEIPKKSGYARTGLPLYSFDPMYDYLCARGESTAFPNREDVPRGELVSFDEFYIPTVNDGGEKVFHRVTLTRAHTRNKGQAKGCFIDGNLAYTSGTGALYDRVTLYNPGEWNSGAKPLATPHLWFSLGDTRIAVIANDNFSKSSLLWAWGISKVPDHYALYINDTNVHTGKTKAQQDKDNRFWRCGWILVLLFPVWVLFVLFVVLLSPILAYTKKCEIRMFLVEPASGFQREFSANNQMKVRKVTTKDITHPTKTSALLS